MARARTIELAVQQRVSTLRPVAGSVDRRSAVVGSQLGMSGRYNWQRLGWHFSTAAAAGFWYGWARAI